MPKKPQKTDETKQKVTKKAPSRGGFRENSGRKPIYKDKVTRSFLMPGELIEQITKAAEASNKTVNAFVVDVLTNAVSSD